MAFTFPLLALTACSPAPKVAWAEVSGKVELANLPLAGALVTYYPISESKTQLPIASATTESNGSYVLTNQSNQKGAVVGKNRVVVMWPPERNEDRDKAPRSIGRPAIPNRYTIASETPLIVDVKAGEPQTINLTLKK